MESDNLEPQHMMSISINQVGHAPEVIQTQGAWVPAKPRAQHQTARKQIKEDYPLLEDILNPIPVDITLSGKYPDTPENADALASVEVLPEFRRQGKQLVGAEDQITLMHGTKSKHFLVVKNPLPIFENLSTPEKKSNFPSQHLEQHEGTAFPIR